jgi:hypothetical protein
MTDELRALAEAATPGPWEIDWEENDGPESYPIGFRAEDAVGHDVGNFDGSEADAALIVAACNALPALLDRLDKAEAALSVERIAAACETAGVMGADSDPAYFVALRAELLR